MNAAAVCPSGRTASKVRHIFLGSSTDRSELETELAGILAATQFIKQNILQPEVTIFSDSQDALRALNITRPGPGQALLCRIQHEITTIHHRKHSLRLCLVWIPGHSDIPGNDDAHREAQRAASNRLTSSALRHFELATLPPSIMTLRHQLETKIKDKWREH